MTAPGRTCRLVLAAGPVVAAVLHARGSARRPPWEPPAGDVVRAGPLAVRVAGEGRPVLLLHGLLGSGRFWGRAYDALARRGRLVVPDLLGFGRSDHPPAGYGPGDHVAALEAALDDLGVAEPAVVGAHSLGCVIALRLAATRPERVAAVVGFGPPLYPDRLAARRHIGAASPMAKLFVLPGRAAEAACRWVCDHREAAAAVARWTHPSLPAPLADDAVEHSWRSYSETLERCLLTGEPATWLPAVRAPVRLVAGRRDRVVDGPYLATLGRSQGHVRLEHWRGDHRLPLTHPGRCLAAIEAAGGGV